MQLNYLDPKQCALLVVDIQERLMPVIDGRERVVKNSRLLIKTARSLHIPIIATTQSAARIGNLLPEISAELPDLTPVDKMEFSCFANTAFQARLRGLPQGIDKLIVCGVEAHICIYQTVLGGLIGGYKMWVPADAVSARTEHNYRTGLERIRDIGGSVANSELIIYELLGKAGTPEFKGLLPFLK
jgi:nicotinamidase-related amidase